MEAIDIAIIVLTTVVVLVMCGSCVTKGRVYNRQLALRRFNAVTPIQTETEEEMENSNKTEETQRTYPTIVISCL